MKLLIRGGRLVDPSQGLDEVTDVMVEEGEVAAVGGGLPDRGAQVIEASGLVVTPGLIDMHVHLREPGREDKETVESGSRAAAAGGFSSVVCMPNTDPVIDNEATVRFVRGQAQAAAAANVFVAGAISKGLAGKQLSEIGEMVKGGIVAVTDDGRPVMNSQLMRRAFEYARIFDIPVLDHCEDLDLGGGGCMNESSASTRLGLAGHHSIAEEIQAVRDILLSRITGCRAHIMHLSCRGSLQQVRRAKDEGLGVTCEAAPHHFTLCDEDIRDYDTNFKMHPPLRTQDDVEAILEGLADGSIDCIASDHAPHTSLEKDVTFPQAANGIIGLETSLPLAWDRLVASGRISPSRLVELMSVNPSRILKLERGTLRRGAVADVTLIDPQKRQVVDPSRFRSKSRNCPFAGWELQGAAVMTIVAGRVAWALDPPKSG